MIENGEADGEVNLTIQLSKCEDFTESGPIKEMTKGETKITELNEAIECIYTLQTESALISQGEMTGKYLLIPQEWYGLKIRNENSKSSNDLSKMLLKFNKNIINFILREHERFYFSSFELIIKNLILNIKRSLFAKKYLKNIIFINRLFIII